MFRKITALTLMIAVCLTVSSCTFKTSGKPYIVKSPGNGVADGMYYSVERFQTDNFICYKAENGRVMLYPVNEKKTRPYDPENLCDVTPGEIYRITYDAQRVTGGIAGHNDRLFLTVYSCRKCSYEKLFENGLAKVSNRWNSTSAMVKPATPKGTAGFIAFRNEDGSYEMYTKEHGKTHYDMARVIKYDVKVNDGNKNTLELQFNVLCQSGITDEYIIEHLTQKKPYDESEFILVDCFHADYQKPDPDHNYDSIEMFSTGSLYHHHRKYYDSKDAMTGGPRRLITYEEMSTKSREELGLDHALYQKIYFTWAQLRDGDYYAFGKQSPSSREPATACDVLIFSGDFSQHANFMYDRNLKLYVNDGFSDQTDPQAVRHPYIILFIRCEFNDMFPQD